MVKKMLINASQPEECRVAVVCDGILEELDVQVKAREATLGNIYKGVVSRIEPSLQAVFVDYGADRNGFLSINDVHPSYFPESFEGTRRRPRIQDVFKKDDHVLVQVNKEERYTKGACLTTNISLAGRYLVLMPGTDLYGVSRKIEDEKERQKLKEIVKQFRLPDNMGFIIRTAGMGRTKTELARDLEYLMKLWESIEGTVAKYEAPVLLYREHDIVIRSIREHYSSDISEILVDEKETHRKVREFFHQVMPKYENLVKLYQEKRPLFNKYQLEEQVEQVYRKKIRLKSGGYIIIEPTEALVTVDVNSGSATKEKGIEDTAFRVNMEAAPEIARQLRLRDLGGIIVIDFIDMTQKMHKQEVEKALKAVMRTDRAKSKILRISLLGLLELSRQRLRSVLGTGEYLECPMCDGQGRIKSPEMAALSVFRKIKSLLIKTNVTEVRATVPVKAGEYLLNRMRAALVEMESQYGARVTVIVKENLPEKDITVEALKEEALEATPIEAIITAPSSVEVVAVVEEEVAVPEPEQKRASKSRQRRRRGRRKPAGEPEGIAAEAMVAAESEAAFEEEPREGAILEQVAPEAEIAWEDLVAASEEQAAEPDTEFLAEIPIQVDLLPAVEAAEETVEILSDDRGHEAGRAEEETPSEIAELAEASNPGSEEPAVQDELSPSEHAAAETPPEPEKKETKEKPARKSRLQHYLPFS
jgi:ribonuclease E